jgi:predicted O-methyltransferase YrrM
MKSESNTGWSAEAVLALGRSYQPAAVLAAAADLDLFTLLADSPKSAQETAAALHCDHRAMTILLDVLAALKLVEKSGDRYRIASGLEPFLTASGDQSVLAMAQHQANCLRNWARLASAVKTGQPPGALPSVRGERLDQEAFIGAMHNVSTPVADEVIRAVQPLSFTRLLDVGGASGTWTMAFLRACAGGTAILLDLPEVIPLARKRLGEAGLSERVTLVPGDYLQDTMPGGVDLAWVSAIIHQNSREQNRVLFKKVFSALAPRGRLAIRDLIMEPSRTEPPAGALFAVNMLVGTPAGGTYTFTEIAEDLQSAGFGAISIARQDGTMNSVVVATRG